ncbi:hypothetical protein BU24DRAFT_487870 [Aaosphaeria arxii CBS 175.79]|uniref:EamA domain-containing protein n=1 Tax=Aaosphaeria arxii CBS 175.79 TaxID=1450172 RepID=A0A6A5YA28_9PLEO|nr:uncharacterized protein BU24DRAFT_487870 [Aaosphaeria arxii CBS 175.79]KAF2021454.1 hypothetical protein BU24DRAFT_487870 [Aaosphaeria arxii CBS 175.79]
MAYGTTQSTATLDTPPSESIPTPSTSRDAEEHESELPTRVKVWQRLKSFYYRNFGLFLVFLAQTCGSIMNTAAKLLATGYEEKFHSLQIIFVRMSCTTIIGCLYMWYNKTPDFPLGRRGVRKLLVLRGFAGFIGLFGLYYSLTWLEFSDATVITFLIPTMTAIVCFVWLREPFTYKEAFAGFIAFCGVLFVARPRWLFPHPPADPISGKPEPHGEAIVDAFTMISEHASQEIRVTGAISVSQHTIAIMLAIVGTLGASMAYATIRVIGKRSHALISVNYFAAIATVGSATIILAHPDLHFVIPRTLGQWGLVTIIGLTGFLLQFLLTEGLQREKAGRATNLTYLQLVFALVIERVIWGTTPPVESLVGAMLIIGAAIWVSLQKNAPIVDQKTQIPDEESRLLGDDNERTR